MQVLRCAFRITAAAFTTAVASLPITLNVQADTPVIPPSLIENVERMFGVLETMPQVSDPKVAYVTTEGWTHPVFEYRAEEDSWLQPTRVEARRNSDDSYFFQTLLPGLSAHGRPVDHHVTSALIKAWRIRCHVSVEAHSA